MLCNISIICFQTRFYTCLNFRLEEKLAELTRMIDHSTPTKELQVIFPQLINNIFASSNGWNLKTVTCDNTRTNRYEFEALISFLEPQGPMFRLCYKLLSDPQYKYNLPLSVLPVSIKLTYFSIEISWKESGPSVSK